jgi:hypothetical protein
MYRKYIYRLVFCKINLDFQGICKSRLSKKKRTKCLTHMKSGPSPTSITTRGECNSISDSVSRKNRDNINNFVF